MRNDGFSAARYAHNNFGMIFHDQSVRVTGLDIGEIELAGVRGAHVGMHEPMGRRPSGDATHAVAKTRRHRSQFPGGSLSLQYETDLTGGSV
jgi:hypothetical protein